MADIKAAYEEGKKLQCRCAMGMYTATLPLFVPMPSANTWIFSGSGALTAMNFPAQSLTIAINNGTVLADNTRLATLDDISSADPTLGLTGATVGQIAKIAAVDESGVPTAWEPVDMPQGEGEREWIKIGEVTTTEDTTETTSIKFTKDVNGNSLSLKGVLVIGRALINDANKHHCILICNDDPHENANYFLYEQFLRNAQTFMIYSEFLRVDGVNSVVFTAFNSGNVKQNGGSMSTINTWAPNYVHLLQFPMRGVQLTIPSLGLLAGSKFEFWGVKA